jgi:quercetin dioxygenase-like cupin family protein
MAAQVSAPLVFLPDKLPWVSPPNNPRLRFAWILGNEQNTGAYLLRVRLEAQGRIQPHTHPDERVTTVLAGTIHIGFGQEFDQAKTTAIPAGAVYLTPANVPHYVWAGGEEVVYQEAGFGPTGTSFIKH